MSNYGEIKELAEKIDCKIDKIYMRVNENRDNNSSLRIEIEILKHAILGNGSPGLFDLVKNNMSDIKNLRDRPDRERKFKWPLYVAVFFGFAGIAWNIIEIIIK
jgi:hypothetical protein